MEKQPLWIFLHLPKSGGTTFKVHLEKHLRWDEELVEFSHWGRRWRQENGRPEFAERGIGERQRARILAGHNLAYGVHRLVPGREARYITFVRDPAERCVSLYNFRRSKGLAPVSFDAWYADEFRLKYRESMVRFFAERLVDMPLAARPEEHLALSRQLLTRCWHVGSTARLDQDLDLLCEAIGIPAGWETVRQAGDKGSIASPTHPFKSERVTRFVALDDALRARIYADSPCDFALYEWAGQRRVQRMDRSPRPSS
jgi:hypothetical protein